MKFLTPFFSNGASTMFKKILAVCAAAAVALPGVASADGRDRRVIILNGTDDYIMELYASGTNSPSWLSDRLGSSIIPPGGNRITDLDDGSGECLVDIKAILEPRNSRERRTIVKRRVDACSSVYVSF